MLQAQPRSPKPPALSPEPLQRARSRRPSTGGSLPSASAGAAGASGGLRLPSRRVNQDAHLQGGAGGLSIPWSGGLVPGSPLKYSAPAPSPGAPGFPGRSPRPVPQSPPVWRNAPTAPLLASAGGVPGLTLGGSSSCGAGFKNKREFLRTRVDCSNRERSMNISLRWFKLSNNITKPSVLAGI